MVMRLSRFAFRQAPPHTTHLPQHSQCHLPRTAGIATTCPTRSLPATTRRAVPAAMLNMLAGAVASIVSWTNALL